MNNTQQLQHLCTNSITYILGCYYCLNYQDQFPQLQYFQNKRLITLIINNQNYYTFFAILSIISYILALFLSVWFIYLIYTKRIQTIQNNYIFQYLDYKQDIKLSQNYQDFSHQLATDHSSNLIIRTVTNISQYLKITIMIIWNRIQNYLYYHKNAKYIYFYIILFGLYLRLPSEIIELRLLYHTHNNQYINRIMMILYMVFKNITQFITLFSFLFITSIVTSQRELVFINQIKNKQIVTKTNAKIIYYHITKSFTLSLLITVFRQLMYISYRGSNYAKQYILVEEFSQHNICQAENVLVYIVIIALVDFSYYKKDNSINMGINKKKQTYIYSLIKKYQNQILYHTFSSQNISQILLTSYQVGLDSFDQTVQDQLQYQTEIVDIQLKNDLDIVDDQQFIHFKQSRDPQQPSQLGYLIVILLIYQTKLAISFCYIYINNLIVQLTDNHDQNHIVDRIFYTIKLCQYINVLLLILEYLILNIYFQNQFITKDILLQEKNIRERMMVESRIRPNLINL